MNDDIGALRAQLAEAQQKAVENNNVSKNIAQQWREMRDERDVIQRQLAEAQAALEAERLRRVERKLIDMTPDEDLPRRIAELEGDTAAQSEARIDADVRRERVYRQALDFARRFLDVHAEKIRANARIAELEQQLVAERKKSCNWCGALFEDTEDGRALLVAHLNQCKHNPQRATIDLLQSYLQRICPAAARACEKGWDLPKDGWYEHRIDGSKIHCFELHNEADVTTIERLNKAIASLHNTMVFDVRDWAQGKSDAWLYGIVVGWGNTWDVIATRHKWDSTDLERLKCLHAALSTQPKLPEVK